HTNSALAISRAATRAMICSSSWDSANMESSSTPTTWEWSPADIATGTITILILVLDEAATVKGPYDDIRRPARYTASQGPQCQTASTGDHKPIFTPLGRPPGQNGSYGGRCGKCPASKKRP